MMFDGDRHRTFEIYIGESTPWQLSSLSSLNDAIKRKKAKKKKARGACDRHFARMGNEVCSVNQLRSRTPSP